QIRLVNERSALERVTDRFLGHACCRQFPQLIVDEWQQLVGSVGVAPINGRENLSDVGQVDVHVPHTVVERNGAVAPWDGQKDCATCQTASPVIALEGGGRRQFQVTQSSGSSLGSSSAWATAFALILEVRK